MNSNLKSHNTKTSMKKITITLLRTILTGTTSAKDFFFLNLPNLAVLTKKMSEREDNKRHQSQLEELKEDKFCNMEEEKQKKLRIM